MDDFQCGGNIYAFPRRDDLSDAIEDFQRLALRRAQAQATSNGIDVSVHASVPVAAKLLLIDVSTR